VATGLAVPWSVAVLPDGSALVTLRDAARVVRIAQDGTVTPVVATGPRGTVPGVRPSGEGGLLGVTVSPAFAEDQLVYLYLTAGAENRIVRARLDGDRLGKPTVLLAGIPASRIHNGGRLAFGPDGMLYATTGDATNGEAAQDPGSLSGKILRLTPDGKPAPGNPFAGSPVWSLGHRNVQGIGWDAAGRMYASEFGQNRLDELNLIKPGANYGWPHVEGSGGAPRFTDPLVTWTTDEASPSGILVTGDAVYLAALRGERLWRVPLADGRVGTPEPLLVGDLGRLRDVVLAPDGGSLYVLTNNTARGTPRAGDDRLVRLPLS
jgi:glucose/arabinose dehydrogenase